jgi:hypothetical protein
VQEKKTAIGASSHATADGFNMYAKEWSIDAATAADDGLQGKNTP